MDNKPLLTTLLIIIIAALGITGFAAVSSFNTTKKLTNTVNQIQNKQNEMEGKLGEIAGKIGEEESADNNDGTNPEKPKNEDETKDWKTYANEKYNYTLNYPQELEVIYKEITSSKDEVNVLDFLTIKEGGDIFVVRTLSNPSRLSPENSYLKFIEKFLPDSLDYTKQIQKNDFNENSLSGVEFFENNEDGKYRNIVFNSKDSKLTYAIDYPVSVVNETVQDNDSMRIMFEKILSTFEFIK